MEKERLEFMIGEILQVLYEIEFHLREMKENTKEEIREK